jgi:hypothetical protein
LADKRWLRGKARRSPLLRYDEERPEADLQNILPSHRFYEVHH